MRFQDSRLCSRLAIMPKTRNNSVISHSNIYKWLIHFAFLMYTGLIQPKHATLEGFENLDVSDLTLGVDWSFVQVDVFVTPSHLMSSYLQYWVDYLSYLTLLFILLVFIKTAEPQVVEHFKKGKFWTGLCVRSSCQLVSKHI